MVSYTQNSPNSTGKCHLTVMFLTGKQKRNANNSIILDNGRLKNKRITIIVNTTVG